MLMRKLLALTYFEYGDGDYDSFNGFADGSVVMGRGDTEYYGLGLVGRYQLQVIFM